MFTKREWIEEYKKLNLNFKIDERNMIQMHLCEDYHANKIFNSQCGEVEQEKRFVDDAIEKIKLAVDDIYAYLKGYQKGKNLEIRQRIIKIEELVNKNRMDFKNKFESLLLQEEEIENEILQFENYYEFNNAIGKNNSENTANNEEEANEEFDMNNNPGGGDCERNSNAKGKNKNLPDKASLENYIEYILSNAYNNAIFEEYSEAKLVKMITKITDLGYIKDKTYQLELLVEKNLGGFNLGWQPRDHQEFLKLRAAHNNKINTYEFFSELENILPFLPKSELKSHIKEYSKFIRLTELKKLLIARYKEIKIDKENNEKKKLLENIEKNKQNDLSKKTNLKINNFLKANASNANLNNLSESKILEVIENEMQEKQKKLEDWKLQKELKKREQQDQKYREEMEKKERERYLYEEKKRLLQPQIEEYKKYKNYIKQEQELYKQTENKFEVNEIDMERIKEKNTKLLESKMTKIKQKSVNKFKSAEKFAKFKIKRMQELEKVPSKLNTRTENVINKQRKKHDYTNNKTPDTMGGNVLGRMARAIPEWRKGLFT